MGRSRQEIVEALMEKSQADPILGSVISSLVGRELLYFGANVIYQLESLGDAVASFADIARADLQQLIAYAYTHDVPCDTTKPAVVSISVRNMPAGTVYPPFAICLHIGGCRFYNIDFVSAGAEINLYQGTPCAMRSNSTGDVLDAFGVDTALAASLKQSRWKLYKEFILGKYQSSYVKLGELAISDSVRVFAREMQTGAETAGIVFPYSEFNQQLASPNAKLYKVRTGWDSSLNVLFGDDNWSAAIAQDQFDYEIYWLEATLLNYTPSSRDELYLGFGATTPVKSTEDKNNPLAPVYTVTSFTAAEAASLPYAKSFVQEKRAFQLGIVTEQQINNYLRGLTAVNSITVDVSSDGTINVYIKPADPANAAFGFVEDYLYQYGVAGTTYNVRVATPLNFSVALTAVGTEGQLMLAQAQQIIDEYCAYEKLTISTPISSALLTQQLQRVGINAVTAAVAVTNEPVTAGATAEQPLTAPPEINSIKQYDAHGMLIGYDANGLYYIIEENGVEIAVDYVSAVGDFIFLCSKAQEQSWLVTYDQYSDGARFYGVETTNIIRTPAGQPLLGKAIEYTDDTSNVYIIAADGQSVYRFAAGWFTSGPGSLLHNQVLVVPNANYTLPDIADLKAPLAFWNTEFYYYYDGSIMQWRTVADTNAPLGTATGNPFFILDNTLYALPTETQPGFSYGLLSNSFTVITSMTPNSNPLGTLHTAEGNKLLDARQVNAFVLSLAVGADANYLHTGRLLGSNGATLTFLSETNVIKFAEAVKPKKILAVRNDTIYLADAAATTLWVVSPAGDIATYSIPATSVARANGSVDYTSNVIYGINPASDSYLSYNVAGTIEGISIYPKYVNG